MKRLQNLISERGEARTVLATLMVVILCIGVLQLVAWSVGGSNAFGQGSPSPSGSEFKIQFLNPSAGTSRELSTKNDGTDSQYHLVAWVNKLPPSPTVEFKYQGSGTNREDTIPGTVQQVGNDTFEIKWDLANAGPEGDDTPSPGGAPTRGTSGALRVILYSSGTEVARDEETVRINQADPGSCPSGGNPTCEDEPQANTVELTYPTNGGGLGNYRPNPGNGPRNSVFDVTVSAGAAGDTVKSFYTLSVPGSEPTWKACQSGSAAASEARPQVSDGVRCEYLPADNPFAVTAVAVRIDDSQATLPQPQPDTDTSDAHRVIPYEQEVTTVEVANAGQSFDAGKCSAAMTVTAKDQIGRKIADTNIDVHASGPTDDLSFDDSAGAYTSPNKAPENHAAESGRACETANNPPFSGSQGEHEKATPVPDIKHLESLNDTNDAGQWLFALHSPVNGAAQFTAWADEDSNDRQCSAEAQVDGAIGWGQAAPAATGQADEDTTCPRPQPSGSATPTGGTSSAPGPSGTSTQAPQQPRSITFTSSKARGTAGQEVTFAGQIFASDEACQDDEFVRLTRRVHGTRTARNFATTRSNANGRFELTIRMDVNAEYQAVAPNHDNCADGFSSPVNLQVKARVGLKAKDARVGRGDRVKLTAKVNPNKRGDKVLLQRRRGNRWVTVDKAKLNRQSKVVFRIEADWRGPRNFRARWKQQDQKNESNNSKPVKVRSGG